MMKVDEAILPKRYHSAVEHWQEHNFKDYQTLLDLTGRGPCLKPPLTCRSARSTNST